MRISDWSSDVCSSDLADDRGERAEIDDMPPRQHDRRARHIAVELEEGDDRSREGDRADRDAKPHFDAADGEYLPRGIGDPERLRIEIGGGRHRSEEHTSELQSLMRISYAVFCLTQ